MGGVNSTPSLEKNSSSPSKNITHVSSPPLPSLKSQKEEEVVFEKIIDISNELLIDSIHDSFLLFKPARPYEVGELRMVRQIRTYSHSPQLIGLCRKREVQHCFAVYAMQKKVLYD